MSRWPIALGWLAVLIGCSSPAPAVRTPASASPPPAALGPGSVLFSRSGVDLWAAAPDGSARSQVTVDGALGPYVGARASPDGRLIAAERSMPGEAGTSLHLLRPGARPLRLTAPGTFLDGFAWSPDGRYLAFGEVSSGATAAAGGLTAIGAIGSVHLYDVAAAKDRTVGPGTHPAFTPDGARLGYAHLSGAIAVADVRSVVSGSPTAPEVLVTLEDLSRYSRQVAPRGMGLLGGPQFSSDGTLVAYSAIEKGPILEAEQIVYVQPVSPGAPPEQFVLGKTGAIHHVAEMRWSPSAPLLGLTIIYAQPHHHWLYVIDARANTKVEIHDSQAHFLDFTWSPDGRTMLLQVDDRDEWLYFRPDRGGRVGRVSPGGWRPQWCLCDLAEFR